MPRSQGGDLRGGDEKIAAVSPTCPRPRLCPRRVGAPIPRRAEFNERLKAVQQEIQGMEPVKLFMFSQYATRTYDVKKLNQFTNNLKVWGGGVKEGG